MLQTPSDCIDDYNDDWVKEQLINTIKTDELLDAFPELKSRILRFNINKLPIELIGKMKIDLTECDVK